MFSSAQTADYISLSIGNEHHHLARTATRSIWRQWNQLSRFQRNMMYFLVITIILIIFYLIPTNTQNDTVFDRDRDEGFKAVQDIPKHNNDEKVLEDFEIEPADTKNDVPNAVLDQPEQHDTTKLKIFDGSQNERQEAVVNAFLHSWNGYKKYAWGFDNIKPISRGHHEWFGLGLTIVDSLDTMYIMGLNDEFNEARNWVKNEMVFTKNRDVNLFEVTIRVLGGLLASYHLSGDKMFLDKAIDLGDRMLPAFQTRSGIPYSDVNLGTKNAHSPKWSPDSSTSEVTSIQLEFRDLSRSSKQPRFEEAVTKVSELVHKLNKYDGLVPIFINPNTGMFREFSTITLGARGDSYYEYLLKQWIQTGKTLDYLKNDYLSGISGTQKHLVKKTAISKYFFIAELIGAARDVKPKMDHLTCYLGGTLALGVHNGLPKDHMQLAEELTRTCYQTYIIHPTNLAPEITYFNIQPDVDGGNQKDMYVKTNDAHNLLRPEFIESLYYLWYYTGNKTYQDWGWKIFQAFENYTKVESGFTSINNVRNAANPRPRDMTESFWFGETLKYLYLLFDDSRSLINLDEWVFNSEGHPLPIYKS